MDDLGDSPDALTLDSDPTIVNTNAEAREQKTLSGNGNAANNKRSG